MVLWRLLISTLAFRKVRAALTIAAVALAISLVVAITSGYASAEAALHQFVRYYVGGSSIEISPKGDPEQVISEGLIAELQMDPAVRQAVGRLETAALVGQEKKGESVPQIRVNAIGVRLPDDAQVQAMKRDAGEWFVGSAGEVAVVDQVMAERMKLGVGDELTLLHPDRPLKVRVVGIVHKPALLAMHMHTIYLPLETMQRYVGRDQKVSRIFVDLQSGTDEAAFAAQWGPRLEKMEPVLRLRQAGQRQREMQKNMTGVQFVSYMGGTVAMLAATFIVFTTLSMGVAERTRSLAMLRAVGADRAQIGQLVVMEGGILAALGALVGVPLGILWTHLLAWFHETLFSAGVVISHGGVAYAAAGMIAAAIVASFMPAWIAMRIKPLDAMAPLGQPTQPRKMLLAAGLGLLLLAVDPLIIFTSLLPREFAFYAHFVPGVPALFIGFFLLSPLVVWIVERTFGHIVAPALRLDYSLLRQQLTGSLWRAAGTAAALMVGLSILVVMQVQGATLLSGWRLPDKFPDIFVVATVGLTPDQQKNVLETAPGIKPGEVLPIAVSSPQLGMQLFSIGSTNLLPDATMFFGIDPDRAAQMIEFEYYEGNAQEAMRKLKQCRHVIVTNEFKQLKGIKVGDKLPLKTPMSGMVDYTVAAVVWSPGLDVIVSAFDMGRQLEQRTVASVCGSLEDARRDFGVDRVNLFAVNLQSGVQKEDLAASLSDRADQTENPTTQSAAGGLLSRGLGVSQLRKVLGKYGFLVGDVRHIKYEMQQGFKRMLLLLSTVALAAIIVASLGVTNTIMASIRSRQWQFGILRSIGVTRGQLLRLILAEALLLGLAGCVLGLGAGFLLSIDANGVTRMVVGYGPAMVVPWGIIGAGVGIIIGVALFASIWPALSAVFQKPLDLLQWGRAAA